MVDKYITARVATAAAILNITNNGKTMESTANVVLTVDGVAVIVNDWILVKDQVADDTQNGLYQMTQIGIAGGGGQHWILNRLGDGLMLKHNMLFHLVEGTANAGKLFRLTTVDLITPGATSIPAGNFVEEPQNISGDVTGDILADDGTEVLENGTDGTDATFQGDILANNTIQVLENGTTGLDSWYRGDLQADNGTVVVDNGTDGTNAWAKTDIQANNGTVILSNGTDGTNAYFTGDIHAENNDVVLVNGTTGITSSYTGTINSINNLTTINVGAVAVPATGTIVATENGDAYHHRTTLTITGVSFPAVPGAGALAFGELIYTLPAGNVIVTSCSYSATMTSTVLPEVAVTDGGIGTALAAGAFATLNLAGAGAENIVTGTAGVVDGATATTALISNQILSVPTANAHTVYLNVASTWSAAETISTTAGSVVIDWMFMT
jgi:hypothetical protein